MTPEPGGLGVTPWRVMRAEWTKLFSLRSTRWCLVLAVVIMILVPIIFAEVQMSQWSTLSPYQRATFDPIDVGASGHYLAEVAIALLGILLVSSEYSTGSIRATFMAVPRRITVLGAKLVVFAVVCFALMLVSSVAAFFITQAIVTVHHVQRSLADPHALRVVLMTPVMLTVMGAFGIGLGALVRSTAAAAGIFVVLVFVVIGLTALLPAHLASDINPYLPANAAFTAATSTFDPGPHLSTWVGSAGFTGFVAIVALLAAQRFRRGDA